MVTLSACTADVPELGNIFKKPFGATMHMGFESEPFNDDSFKNPTHIPLRKAKWDSKPG